MKTSARQWRIGILYLAIGMIAVLCLLALPDRSHAEGSRNLIEAEDPSMAYRPYLYWEPWSDNMGITMASRFKVYAKSGETLYLGSSVHNAYDAKDIYVVSPSGHAITLDVMSSGEGYISTITQEMKGPFDASGYSPLTVNVSDYEEEAGWWTIEFHGELGEAASNHNPDPKKVSEPWGAQRSGVAAWDITVSSDGTTEIPGRMYTDFLAMNTGSQSPEVKIYSEVYVLTKDGYRYRVNLNGITPYGFVMFANNRGFIDDGVVKDGIGNTLNRSVVINTEAGHPPNHIDANIVVQNPADTDSATDVTHRLFLNEPAADLPAAFTGQIAVPEPVDTGFAGYTDTSALMGAGGKFRFTIDTAATYQLIIDADADGTFSPGDSGGDIVLESSAASGYNEVVWDGKLSDGNVLPDGEYKAQILMKGGEYHFPMLDVEYAENGIIVELLNAPGYSPADSYPGRYTVYYNDNNYTTANGISINLDGDGAPVPRDASGGISSEFGAHGFTDMYGDYKAIDTWTYFPGSAVEIPFTVIDRPGAIPMNVETNEDEAVGITLSGADVETSENDLIYRVSDLPTNGTLSGTGRHLTYTPNLNFNGTDSFQFTVTDETDTESTPATVSIVVNAVNDAPVAIPQDVTTFENVAVAITLGGSDAETAADDLIYSVTDIPENGTLSGTGRQLTYTPTASFNGEDSFYFTVSDSVYESAPAQVRITVVAVNDVPIAIAQDVTTDEDTPVAITLSGTDAETAVDDLQYRLASMPGNGIMTGIGRNWIYSPDANFNGSDQFTFTVTDSVYESAPAIVRLTVNAVNDAPTAADVNVATDEDTPIAITLVGTDIETPTDELTYTVTTGPTHGALTGSGRHLTYTPAANYNGTDSFAYTVTDSVYGGGGALASAAATVHITVNPAAAPDPTPGDPDPEPSVEEIDADVQTGGSNPGITVLQTKIRRVTDTDGTVRDQVQLTQEQVQEAIRRLDETGADTARLLIPDEDDAVAETRVDVAREALQDFVDGQKHLELFLEYAKITVPYSSMDGFGDDLYFRIVPVRNERQKEEIAERAKSDERVAQLGNEQSIRMLGRPMMIETNMQSRPVTIVLPLYDRLPDDPAERQEILDNLVIYIEHSDGSIELIKGIVTQYKTGEQLGIEFEIDKFSTFTMIYWAGSNAYFGSGASGLNEAETNQAPGFRFEGITGYIIGYPDGTFRPDKLITRAEMAAMIARNPDFISGGSDSGRDPAFSDLQASHWAYSSIRTVARSGVMIGYPDGSFHPDQAITRAEMASLSLRLLRMEARDGFSFGDTEHHWARGAIEALKKIGVLSGYPDGSFRPNQGLNRAEAVVIVNRLLHIEPKEGELPPSWPDVPATHWAFAEIEAATAPFERR